MFYSILTHSLIRSSVHTELIDTGDLAHRLCRPYHEQAHIAHAGRFEVALHLIAAVAVEQVEGLPLLGITVASLQQTGTGDKGKVLNAGIHHTPTADGRRLAEVEDDVIGSCRHVAPLGRLVVVGQIDGTLTGVALA